MITRFSKVAFFSMEIGVDEAMPTYSGGLGILAGDMLRAAADLGLSMVGMTLLYRKGYFQQRLDDQGNQTENDVAWSPEDHLELMEPRITITIEGRPVIVRAWRFLVKGSNGSAVPVYFLDTNLEENSPWDRSLTDHLYSGDDRMRLCQETLLGFGGVAILRALEKEWVEIYHLNEGHSSLLTLALLEERMGERGLKAANRTDREAVRQKCVFTTHTPVPAGHDQFSPELVNQVLGSERATSLAKFGGCFNEKLNMTYLGLTFSRYINGVAMRHGEISRTLFPNYPVDSITNGIHAVTWTSRPFQDLFDRQIPEWRHDNLYLRYAVGIPRDEIRSAHEQSKADLLAEVARRTTVRLDPGTLTIGFARRAALYKRADLLFSDLERLRAITQNAGPIQIIYSGKAHPHDQPAKQLIRRIFEASQALKETVKVLYLEEYDMALAKLICSGVDLWLNTPQKPQEASGTSGMKAAVNGVPSLSVLDGWWIEGHVEGVTGWSIGDHWETDQARSQEIDSLYNKLERVILPLFYRQPEEFDRVRQMAIAINGSFFNTQRMMSQYLKNAYFNT